MKKLLPVALMALLVLPALPGGAQLPTPTPTPTASATPTPTATATTAATPAATATGPTLTYAARGTTRSLALELAGNVLGLGLTTARVANAPTEECTGVACATAAAAVEPFGETASATAPGNPGPTTVQAFDLGTDGSEELEQLLTATLGAATAAASEQPASDGTAAGATIDLTLTQTVIENLPPEVTEGLEGGLGQLGDALQPIADGDPTGTIAGITDLLEGLVGDLGASPLLRIQIGESASESAFGEGTVTARAQAAGAIITVLPTPESTPLLPEGLAVIEITPSTATASANGTDEATGAAEGSIARITLLPGVLDALPDLDGGAVEDLPLQDILDLLPPEVTDLLPIGDLIGGGEASEAPTEPSPSESEGGPTGTPLDDILPTFMQADGDSGGFVIDLETGTEQTCILEGTPVETCVTVGGTSTTFSEDRLGIGVLAAGVDVSAIRTDGVGQLELAIGRSEAGAAAAFVTPPAPTPTPTPQTALPQTGGGRAMLWSGLALMGLSGLAVAGLRRRTDG